MNLDEKMTRLLAVEESGFKITETLKRLDIPMSAYYRWRSKPPEVSLGYFVF